MSEGRKAHQGKQVDRLSSRSDSFPGGKCPDNVTYISFLELYMSIQFSTQIGSRHTTLSCKIGLGCVPQMPADPIHDNCLVTVVTYCFLKGFRINHSNSSSKIKKNHPSARAYPVQYWQ